MRLGADCVCATGDLQIAGVEVVVAHESEPVVTRRDGRVLAHVTQRVDRGVDRRVTSRVRAVGGHQAVQGRFVVADERKSVCADRDRRELPRADRGDPRTSAVSVVAPRRLHKVVRGVPVRDPAEAVRPGDDRSEKTDDTQGVDDPDGPLCARRVEAVSDVQVLRGPVVVRDKTETVAPDRYRCVLGRRGTAARD